MHLPTLQPPSHERQSAGFFLSKCWGGIPLVKLPLSHEEPDESGGPKELQDQ
jgi:hypothetical protein